MYYSTSDMFHRKLYFTKPNKASAGISASICLMRSALHLNQPARDLDKCHFTTTSLKAGLTPQQIICQLVISYAHHA
jgi:hypothetical protein